jgi:sugar phosphate isomerase/epimerase
MSSSWIGASVNPGWQVAYSPREVVAAARAAELDYLEVTFSGDKYTDNLMRECTKQGFPVNMHSTGHASLNLLTWNQHEKEHRNQIEQAARLARQSGRTIYVVYHGAHGEMPQNALVDKTVEFFNWALPICRAGNVQPLVELLHPIEEGAFAGNTISDLLEITTRAPGLKICLDLGHAAMSSLVDEQEIVENGEFLNRVGYLHLHDVDDQGTDHHPLYFNRTRWHDVIAALTQAGFTGPITLEYGFELIKEEAFDCLGYDARTIRDFLESKAGE